MPSYSSLCKKAGLPAPTGLADPWRLRPKKPWVRPPALHLAPGQNRPRIELSREANELFLRMFAQLARHEDKHFSEIYELAIKVFPRIYGTMPCDQTRFVELRELVSDGHPLPLFDR